MAAFGRRHGFRAVSGDRAALCLSSQEGRQSQGQGHRSARPLSDCRGVNGRGAGDTWPASSESSMRNVERERHISTPLSLPR